MFLVEEQQAMQQEETSEVHNQDQQSHMVVTKVKYLFILGTTYVRATDSSVVTGSTSGNASYTSGTGTSSGNASYTSGTGSTSGNASYTSGTGGYQRSYGTGLNQSGSSQGSVSYGGRQYTQQSGESSEGTTTQGYRYYTSSRKDQS